MRPWKSLKNWWRYSQIKFVTLVVIFLSINILIVPLSKSAFTVTPWYISNFSTPIFNYTSLNILKVLLTFLCLLLSFAMLSRTSAYTPSCCAFTSLGYTTTPQFHYGFFSPILHSGHKIFPFSFSNTFFFTIVSFHKTLATMT